MNSLEQKESLKDNEIRKLKMRLDEANARIATMERLLRLGLDIRLLGEGVTTKAIIDDLLMWRAETYKALPNLV